MGVYRCLLRFRLWGKDHRLPCIGSKGNGVLVNKLNQSNAVRIMCDNDLPSLLVTIVWATCFIDEILGYSTNQYVYVQHLMSFICLKIILNFGISTLFLRECTTLLINLTTDELKLTLAAGFFKPGVVLPLHFIFTPNPPPNWFLSRKSTAPITLIPHPSPNKPKHSPTIKKPKLRTMIKS